MPEIEMKPTGGNGGFVATPPAVGGRSLQVAIPTLERRSDWHACNFWGGKRLFDRIEFRGISGQAGDLDAFLGGLNVVTHQHTARGREIISDEKTFPGGCC